MSLIQRKVAQLIMELSSKIIVQPHGRVFAKAAKVVLILPNSSDGVKSQARMILGEYSHLL